MNINRENTTRQTCAACKHQRRKCTNDCILAPYFPGDKPGIFANAHRLYGVANILRILKKVKEEDRKATMHSIIYESNARAQHPIDGLYGVINMYKHLIDGCIEELVELKKFLALLEQQNLLPNFSNENSFGASTSTQIPSNPMFNNAPNVPNYFHNIENNDITNFAMGVENLNINSIPQWIDGNVGNANEENSNMMVTQIQPNCEELNIVEAPKIELQDEKSLDNNQFGIFDYDLNNYANTFFDCEPKLSEDEFFDCEPIQYPKVDSKSQPSKFSEGESNQLKDDQAS